MLVGSKCDAESMREVSKEEGIDKAMELGCEYIECSAKENIHIEDVFQKTTNLIYSKDFGRRNRSGSFKRNKTSHKS